LSPVIEDFDHVIVHNIFTKHFNLPLTAALFRMLDEQKIKNCIAWCHDFTWTSPRSSTQVHPGFPWDLLRTYRSDLSYVTVSKQRQQTLAGLLEIPEERVHVVYNGVNPEQLLGLSSEGSALIDRLELLDSDLVLLMPVRVTRAKNIELALQTAAILKESDIRIKLLVTGPPDPHDSQSMAYFQSLRDLRQKLLLEDEVHFVFESGPEKDSPYFIDIHVVADLFRVSDLMFMPSHREGFGMPVLEAGLVGIPVVSTDVPAAEEIGGRDFLSFNLEDSPKDVARLIMNWREVSFRYRLRCRVRQQYTWESIYRQRIQPLLTITQ
jgi:glycosyltransferase involved in cell wall biosynthesis